MSRLMRYFQENKNKPIIRHTGFTVINSRTVYKLKTMSFTIFGIWGVVQILGISLATFNYSRKLIRIRFVSTIVDYQSFTQQIYIYGLNRFFRPSLSRSTIIFICTLESISEHQRFREQLFLELFENYTACFLRRPI